MYKMYIKVSWCLWDWWDWWDWWDQWEWWDWWDWCVWRSLQSKLGNLWTTVKSLNKTNFDTYTCNNKSNKWQNWYKTTKSTRCIKVKTSYSYRTSTGTLSKVCVRSERGTLRDGAVFLLLTVWGSSKGTEGPVQQLMEAWYPWQPSQMSITTGDTSVRADRDERVRMGFNAQSREEGQRPPLAPVVQRQSQKRTNVWLRFSHTANQQRFLQELNSSITKTQRDVDPDNRRRSGVIKHRCGIPFLDPFFFHVLSFLISSVKIKT